MSSTKKVMAQIVAFSCFFVYVYNDVELDHADTELTPGPLRL